MEDVDDFAGKALEFVVEVVGEVVDALVGAFDAETDFGEVFGLLDAELVEFGTELAEELFEFLLERGATLEVIDDFEEDEEDGGERGGVDQPGGEGFRVGGGDFLGEEEAEGKGGEEEVSEHGANYVGGFPVRSGATKLRLTRAFPNEIWERGKVSEHRTDGAYRTDRLGE